MEGTRVHSLSQNQQRSKVGRSGMFYFFLLLLSCGALLHVTNWRWLDIYYYQELVNDQHVTNVFNNLKITPRIQRALTALNLHCPRCASLRAGVLASQDCNSLESEARRLECPEKRCACLPSGMTPQDFLAMQSELDSYRLFVGQNATTRGMMPGDLTCQDLTAVASNKNCTQDEFKTVSELDCAQLQAEQQAKQCPVPDTEPEKKLDCATLQSELQANMCPGSPGVELPPPVDCPPPVEKDCPPQSLSLPQPSTIHDNVFNGVVRGYGPNQWRYLAKEIKRKDLTPVFLEFHRPFGLADAIHVQCRGNPCPSFGRCPASDFKRGSQRPESAESDKRLFEKLAHSVWSCWNPLLEDRTANQSTAPRNFPPDSTQDVQLLQPWLGQVMVLHNVYVNEKGQVFDEKYHFDRNGCGGDMDYSHPGRTIVVNYKDLLSFAIWNGADVGHSLVELLPLFVTTQHVLDSLPGIPIAVRHDQKFFVRDFMKPLMGVDVARLNLQPLTTDKIFFAERLILPIYQWCGRPSRAVWSHLRAHYIMQGADKHLPYSVTGKDESTWQAEPEARLGDWLVILIKRPTGKPRALVQHGELYRALVDMFTEEHVAVYDGSISTDKARLLFMRAKLLVGVHGSGMANMVFMPSDGAVLEIRPSAVQNWRYHALADACSLPFYLTAGEGSRDTPCHVSVQRIIGTVALAMGRFVEKTGPQVIDNSPRGGGGGGELSAQRAVVVPGNRQASNPRPVRRSEANGSHTVSLGGRSAAVRLSKVAKDAEPGKRKREAKKSSISSISKVPAAAE